jgi:hypothetical protein
LRTIDEGLGTYLDLGLGIEASIRGSTIALVGIMLTLVLLTPWERWLNNLVLPMC